MSESIFTKIYKGDAPGEVVFRDNLCFVILTISLAQKLGKIIKKVYNPPKVALSSVGFGVPHVHIHIFSLFKIADIDHGNARSTTPEAMRIEADKIRAAIKQEGLVE